jgi:hypothetical protein
VGALICALAVIVSCRAAPVARARTFATPEEAVRALSEAVGAVPFDALLALFGPDARELIDTADPAAVRRNGEVIKAALAEGWRLVDQAGTRVLVIGNEEWPFPVPLTRDAEGWRFDTAAGREEVIARRIGRNELSVIQACRTYVVAQRLYARTAHDGKQPGLYARTFRSDPGKQNGLYWPAAKGQKRSPLGELLAGAADTPRPPAPFHGYYYRILTAQGSGAPGGARAYVINGDMSGGHALLAWPARYDVTGVMTFLVGQDGIVHEKDLGADTDAAARAMSGYDPDASWKTVQ